MNTADQLEKDNEWRRARIRGCMVEIAATQHEIDKFVKWHMEGSDGRPPHPDYCLREQREIERLHREMQNLTHDIVSMWAADGIVLRRQRIEPWEVQQLLEEVRATCNAHPATQSPANP